MENLKPPTCSLKLCEVEQGNGPNFKFCLLRKQSIFGNGGDLSKFGGATPSRRNPVAIDFFEDRRVVYWVLNDVDLDLTDAETDVKTDVILNHVET